MFRSSLVGWITLAAAFVIGLLLFIPMVFATDDPRAATYPYIALIYLIVCTPVTAVACGIVALIVKRWSSFLYHLLLRLPMLILIVSLTMFFLV